MPSMSAILWIEIICNTSMVINGENFLPDPNLTWGKNKSGALVISNSEKRPDLDPCR